MSGSGGQSQQGSPDTSSSLLLSSAPLETHWGSPRREIQSRQVVLGLPLSSLSWTPFPGGQTWTRLRGPSRRRSALSSSYTSGLLTAALRWAHLNSPSWSLSLACSEMGKVVKTFSLVNWELRLAAQLCLYNVSKNFFELEMRNMRPIRLAGTVPHPWPLLYSIFHKNGIKPVALCPEILESWPHLLPSEKDFLIIRSCLRLDKSQRSAAMDHFGPVLSIYSALAAALHLSYEANSSFPSLN